MADDKLNTTNNKLVKKSLFTARKVGLAARAEEAVSQYDPKKMVNKIVIEFDDSGSMGGKAIEDAKTAVGEFLKSCNPTDTSVGLYHFGDHNYSLTVDFPSINMFCQSLAALYGTPLYSTLKKIIDTEEASRIVIFSDGEPTDSWANADDATINACNEKGVPVDTVYLGLNAADRGAIVLKEIADKTGGIFLHFTGTGMFAKNFKYLAPAFRGYLADKSFVDKITKG